MAIPTTRRLLEGVVNRHIARFSQFVGGVAERVRDIHISSLIPPFLRKEARSSYYEEGEPQHPTQPYAVKAESSGYELGTISRMSFFPRLKPIRLENGEVLTPEHQRALIDYFDEVSKKVHRGISRDVGAPYEAHPIDMIKLYAKIARSLHLPADYRAIGVDIFHDVGEKKLKALLDELEGARKQGLEDRVKSLTSQVKSVRAEFVDSLYQDLTQYVKNYAAEKCLSENQTRALIEHGVLILGVTDWLTRHIEDREFIQSAHALRQLYTAEQYATTDVGGPFQLRVLDVLDVKDGYEPLESYTLRLLKRALDRVVLLLEVKRRFTDGQAEELESILQSNPLLREKYDGVNFRGQDYERAYLLDLVFRSYIVSHNINAALVEHGAEIYQQRKSNPLAYQYLRALKRAREILLDTTGSIIDATIPPYKKEFERDPVLIREAKLIEEEVKNLNPSHFEIMTGFGPITRLNRLDAEFSREQWASLEESWYAKLENYRDWLMLAKLHERFIDPKRNIVRAGNYQLFRIRGVTNKLEINPADIVRYTPRA